MARNLQRDFSANLLEFVRETAESADFQRQHCRDSTCFVRRCLLTFERVFFIQLSLLRAALDRELERFFESLGEEGLTVKIPTVGAFSRARLKMLPEVFRDMNQRVIELFYREGPAELWHGMRLLSFDGTTLRIKGFEKTKRFFGLIRNGDREYSLGRAVQLYDVINGVVVDAVLGSGKVGERDLARRCFESFREGDVVLLDTGYPGFVFFAELLAAGADFCARISSRQWQKTVQPFLQSGDCEQIVELKPNADNLRECREKGLSTAPIRVRVIRVELPDGDVEVLFTSLTDRKRFPLSLFSPLYMRRWRVEEGYKTLKCRIEMENFSGKSVCTVLQDFHARVLMLTLTVMLSIPAQRMCRENTKHRKLTYQLNLTNALAKMRKRCISLFYFSNGAERLGDLWKLLQRCLSAVRPGRHVPRTKTPRDKKDAGWSITYKPLA